MNGMNDMFINYNKIMKYEYHIIVVINRLNMQFCSNFNFKRL